MNIDRSSVGVPELSAGLRFLGSEASENLKTPLCVHECAAPPAPVVEVFVHPASAAASTANANNALTFTQTLLPRARRASSRDRFHGIRKTRDTRSVRSPTA